MEILNLPNALTILRIALVPVFTYFFLSGYYREALAVFIFSGITDFLDGLAARAFKQKTTLGAILDPAADKILITVTFIALSLQGVLPLWLTTLVVARDLYIVAGVGILKKMRRKLYFQPTLLSKWNTFFQLFLLLLSFVLVLVEFERPSQLMSSFPTLKKVQGLFVYLVAAMTLASGMQYTKIGWMILKGHLDYANLPLKKS